MCNCAVNWCDKLCFLHLFILNGLPVYIVYAVSLLSFIGSWLYDWVKWTVWRTIVGPFIVFAAFWIVVKNLRVNTLLVFSWDIYQFCLPIWEATPVYIFFAADGVIYSYITPCIWYIWRHIWFGKVGACLRPQPTRRTSWKLVTNPGCRVSN